MGFLSTILKINFEPTSKLAAKRFIRKALERVRMENETEEKTSDVFILNFFRSLIYQRQIFDNIFVV